MQGQAQSEPPLQLANFELFVPQEHRHRGTAAPCPRRAARAVQVGLVLGRDVVVHDHVDVVDVQAPGSNVGCDQGGQLALGEAGECTFALDLRQVAVDGARLHAGLAQLAGELVGASLGAGEQQGAAVGADDARCDAHPVHLVHRQEEVAHLGHGHLALDDFVKDRVTQVPLDERVDHTVEGGREQQRLVLTVDVAQHPFHLGQEAHVGHAVGFVHDDALDARHVDGAALDEIDEPAWRGDHDVHAVGEQFDLALDVGAAVGGDRAQVGRFGERFDDRGDLVCQLAGRGEHQRGGMPVFGSGGECEHRQAECQGLAGAGLGLAADIPPGERLADGQFLDGERFGDSLVSQGVAEGFGYA